MPLGSGTYKATPGLLSGSVALITGGGTGIGRGLAVAFAREGAAVAITGRRKEPLDATVAEILQAGGKATAVTGNVTDPHDCQHMVNECVLRFGGVSILVNNAGIAPFGALEATSDEVIHKTLDINLLGAILMTKYAAPELCRRRAEGGGAILNIGTSAALKAVKNFSVYSAAKAGLIQFTRCTALELAEEKVRVNCINPGVVETPIFSTMFSPQTIGAAMAAYARQTPLGRVGQPADIAEAALFLCGPKSSWITGAVLSVDGGISLP